MFRDYVHLSLNGKLHKITGKFAFLPFSEYLRYEKGLTGTKVVCAEGDCGACSVMFQRVSNDDSKFQSLNTCICPGILLDSCHVISVEGLKVGEELSEVQDSIVRNFSAQCGFCTPGFVVSMANLFEQKTDVTKQNVKNYLTGNLCRCTGYSSIINAALDVDTKKIKPLNQKFNFSETTKTLQSESEKPIKINSQNKEFFAPITLKMATDYKTEHPEARIVSGSTDIGVQVNKGKEPGLRLMSLHLIRELYEIKEDDSWVQVGAKTSISSLQNFLPESDKFSEFLNIFASPQIKNTATLVGNVANGSPIADTTPYLLTADAEVFLLSSKGQRKVFLENFIKGYKNFDLNPDEFITHIRFKKIPPEAKIDLSKISQRRDLDISCVNSSFIFTVDNRIIQDAKIAFGGVGPKTLRLRDIEKGLIGETLSLESIEKTKSSIQKNITPISDARGSAEFRTEMCQNLFERFIHENFDL